VNLGPHADFIIAAYAIAALVLIGLIAWVEVDNRTQWRNLAKLAAQGITRRSEKTT
jgi:heme exporter protein D